jgi:DNA-binding beta-propeller fold protein YncE
MRRLPLILAPRAVLAGGIGTLVLLATLLPAGTAWGASGGFERAWGKNVLWTNAPLAGPEICTAAADCQAAEEGSGAGEFSGPWMDVAADANGNTYVVTSDTHTPNRIQKFDSSGNFVLAWGKNVIANNGATGYEICTAGMTCQGGGWGTGGGELNEARGITVGSDGNVYVADTFNNRIQKFDSNGNFLLTWGKDVNVFGGSGFETCNAAALCIAGDPGVLGGEMNQPHDVATGPGGSVYVADSDNLRVQQFNSSGKFLLTWGKDVVPARAGKGFDTCDLAAGCGAGQRGTLGGEFSGVEAVAADWAGGVYVADAQRIQRFNVQPSSPVAYVSAWGKDVLAGGGTGFEICTVPTSCQAGIPGALGGELSWPRGLAEDSFGDVYVADASNHRIQKFDHSGNFLRAWGKDVAAGGGSDFEICTTSANCQAGTVGGLGGELGIPAGLTTDGAGKLYVAETVWPRIQVFGEAVDPPPPPPPPPTGTTGTDSQTGTLGATDTANPQCQLLRKKLKKAKTKAAKRKIRRKLRALGC